MPREDSPTVMPQEDSRTAVRYADSQDSFGYDVRKGSAAYASILGNMGAFVVTAVVLVFTIASSHEPKGSRGSIGFAAALLVLALFSCLLGAFTFAAISAERKLTANLPAAALHAGVATAVGVVAVLAAFEVLASIYGAITECCGRR